MIKILNKTVQFLTRHSIIGLYSAMFLGLLVGLFLHTRFDYFDLMFLFAGSLYSAYWLIYKCRKIWILPKINFNVISLTSKQLDKVAFTILIITFGFIGFHFWELGGIPVIKAWICIDYDKIVAIRKSVTADHNSIWNYGMSFTLKGIIPFFLFYLYKTRKNILLLILIIIGVFYAISLMQKSFIITILTPLFLYSLLNKRWLVSIVVLLIIFCSLNFLVTAANPVLRMGTMSKEQRGIILKTEAWNLHVTSLNKQSFIMSNPLIRRVVYVPGMIVSEWFRIIPKEKPFLRGNGYRFLSPIISGPYIDYSLVLYPLIYPTYSKRGFSGSVNAASFTYEYANFGKTGLIISGILLAMLFSLLEILFGQNIKIKLSLNAFSLLMLSSGSLFTILFSGSWVLLVGLYFIFKKQLVLTKTL